MSAKRDLTKLTGLLTLAAEAGQAQRQPSTLPVSQLVAGLGQPRREFNEARLQELAQSIRQQGVLQPILVRPVAENAPEAEPSYEIVAGERRWRAAQLAGLETVPVLIRDLSDAQARQVALIENLQRENLNTVDEVDGKLELLATTLGLTREQTRVRLIQMLREPVGPDHQAVEEVFGVLGETWTYFAKNKLRILNWPEQVLEAVRGGLPFTLGAVIVSAPEAEQAQLLALASAGASREELKARVTEAKARWAGQTQAGAAEAEQAIRVAKLLASNRWLKGLAQTERQELAKWLAKMPTSLRTALEAESPPATAPTAIQ